MKSIPALVRGHSRLKNTMGPQIVAALDIGSFKTACIIAEWSPNKRAVEIDTRHGLKILGFGQTSSRGVKAGSIANIADAERSIRLAVDNAERTARSTIRSVHVNVSGGKPRTALSLGTSKTENGIVSGADIDSAISSALAQTEIGKRHVLHLLPASFGVDGVATTEPPLGMHGGKLSVDLAVVTMDRPPLQNLRMAIERSHLTLGSVALTPYASARAVLAADEMELGTILIDMGGYTTSVAVFRNGCLIGSASLPMGGQHITNDIAHGLSTTVVHAERLKTLFGTVLGDGHDDREMLAVPLLGERGVDTVQKVPKHVLTSIIVPRLDELFEHITHLMSQGSLAGVTANRVVITGGASQLHGMREFATTRLSLPVRNGSPMGFQNLPDAGKSAAFATVTGLLVTACEPALACEMPDEARTAIDRSQMSYAQRVSKWLAEAL
jgi:cell division protein FtsA